MSPFQAKLAYAIGIFFWTIINGLIVYRTPPESWEQFGTWMWQPMLSGCSQALGTLGIGAGIHSISRKVNGHAPPKQP